ncbi:DNA-binding transcriptional ArsR family regulator [Arthrobacter sp. UYCu712]
MSSVSSAVGGGAAGRPWATSAGSGEACVCDLTEPLELGQPTVSHHLKILVDAGLLHREKRGTWAYYSLVPGALERTAAVVTGL